MQIESFQDLVKNAQSIEKKSRIAVVAAHDKHTLQ
ncbi:phosphate butyryltransferase Ptb, partial [Clostridium beijerinckii]|nr:phosphate butyryltransferase Ptb [Clostridium beijerinckii]